MSSLRIVWRKSLNYVMLTLTGVAAFAVVSVLFLILGYLLWNGGTSLRIRPPPGWPRMPSRRPASATTRC